MERKEPVPDKKAKRLRVMKIIQTVLTVAVNVFFVMYLSMIIKLAASDGGFTKTSAAMMVFEYFFGYLPASLMLLILLVFNLALTPLFVRGWEISAAAVIAVGLFEYISFVTGLCDITAGAVAVAFVSALAPLFLILFEVYTFEKMYREHRNRKNAPGGGS